MHKPLRYALYASVFLIIVTFSYALWWFVQFNKSLELNHDLLYYMAAEELPSDLPSRQVMILAMKVQKARNLAPSSAARLFAYTASVYADVLTHTTSTNDATIAAARMIEVLIPEQRTIIQTFLAERALQYRAPSRAAQEVLAMYKERARTDGYETAWHPNDIPKDDANWFVRGNFIDEGAASGTWQLWAVDPAMLPPVPTPPVVGSIADTLELEQVRYTTHTRTNDDLRVIFLWHGASGFTKGSRGDNISPAGVWQNILFSEVASTTDDYTYAQAQKALAQSVGDSFILTWREKYRFYTQRPSMRDPFISLGIGDPPFPSYISGHSTISKTAAVTLSTLFPEQTERWHDNASNARRTRLLGGIHFDIDNARGEEYGQMIGEAYLHATGLSTTSISTFTQNPNPVVLWIRYFALRTGSLLQRLYTPDLWHQLTHRTAIHFTDAVATAGIEGDTTSFVTWFDYNGDSHLDLFVQDGLYANNGDGTFTNVTDHALPQSSYNSTTKRPSNAIAGDFDNDGCTDLFLTMAHITPPRSLVFLVSNCDGTFTDRTTRAGLLGSYPTGMAAADFDRDGDLDLAVANWDAAHSYTITPNHLWRNNGNGTFTNVASSLRVEGRPVCPNFKDVRFAPSRTKNSYQPTWFDYDNDEDLDLFVATDTWISPLYRNDGTTFTDVTYESGLCRPGTGMGVAIADVDHNGFQDLYVTNKGVNYLWMNQGDGTFSEEGASYGIADAHQGWATFFLDADNDGDEDLVVMNGNEFSDEVLDDQLASGNRDVFYENDGRGYFHDITRASNLINSWVKRATGMADYNNDGLVDLYVGAVAHQPGKHNPLFMNDTAALGNHWITVDIRDATTHQSPYGARVDIVTARGTTTRLVHSGTSFYSQNDTRVHVGLGKESAVERIIVRWIDGHTETIEHPSVDSILAVTR